MRKTTSTGTLDFLYDTEGHKVAEVDTTGTFLRGELYAGDRHLAVYAPEPGPTGATFFIHADWLGTERARSNMSGTACESITSLPFGDGQAISDSCGDSAGDVSPMHFTGKERDAESGLDNFGARYDSSSMGRFMSPDPDGAGSLEQDPQSWNMYAYARNNPLKYTDPDGLDYKVCVDNGNGGQNCTKYDSYDDFLKAAKASGASLNGGDKNGQILVNGKSVGTYQFFPDPGTAPEENILAPILAGGLFGGLKAGIRGIAEGLFGGGAKAVVEETAVATAEQIVSGGTKQAVREAVESSGLSDAAKAAVKSALRRGAAADKWTVEKLADGTIKVTREVAGGAGGKAGAAYEQVIDGATGITKSVIQKGTNTAGELIHVDRKL